MFQLFDLHTMVIHSAGERNFSARLSEVKASD